MTEMPKYFQGSVSRTQQTNTRGIIKPGKNTNIRRKAWLLCEATIPNDNVKRGFQVIQDFLSTSAAIKKSSRK
jgi:hypothetical protein